MKLCWYGTASMSIKTENSAILLDPFVPLKGSPVKTKLEDYADIKRVLVTHGHVDHIASLPAICKKYPKEIYATKVPRTTLEKLGIPVNHLHDIHPGVAFDIGDIHVTPYKSKHIQYDKALVQRTVTSPRMLRYALNIPFMSTSFKKYPEGNETTAFLMEAEGKSIFVLGSLNLDETVTYPSGMDYLILPYQGSSHLLKTSVEIVRQLKPKTIILNHFDDTFPPISQAIDTSRVEEKLGAIRPIQGMEIRI